MAVASAAELRPVAEVTSRLQGLLQRARSVKPETTVEPPLPTAELVAEVDAVPGDLETQYDQGYSFSVVETAARGIFYDLINSTDIEDAAFVEVWNLLDTLMLCGDRGKSSPVLAVSLLEELLDSQTTAGCRIVFDFLESRRERLAAQDFHQKHLIFLRMCNELLRRLSKAEDAVFCGRVFFFLFTTFPLGDRSSVNLRGEYHVENITTFEADGEQMETDDEPFKGENAIEVVKAETPQPPTKPGGKGTPLKPVKKPVEEPVLTNSELYPIFWRLQHDFSNPTRLFAQNHFAAFKKGLSNTLAKFKKTPTVVQTKTAEDSKRGVKRKLGQDGTKDETTDHLVDNYNPKYLTSQDLFDLELSDLAFQRHILVQWLILIDFLLSLTDKAEKKYLDVPTKFKNKAMLYDHRLSTEDLKWAQEMKRNIVDFMQRSPGGRFFHRMLETVLARDKNWIRWKVESCPPILRDPVSTESVLEARKGAKDVTRIRRLPERPQGAIDLSFLDEGQGGGLEALKHPARYTAPSTKQLIEGVRADKLDLEMAMDDEEKASLENAISNKTWRALRQVRETNLTLLNKVDPGKDIETVFIPADGTQPSSEPARASQDEDGVDADVTQPVVTVTETDELNNSASGDLAPKDEAVAAA